MSSEVLHHLDEPTRWRTPTPVLIVRGWCFDPRGDTLVAIEAVTAGGTVRAPIGLARPDVGAAFGGRPGAATSGFAFWIENTADALEGLLLQAVHRDGSRSPLRRITLQ